MFLARKVVLFAIVIGLTAGSMVAQKRSDAAPYQRLEIVRSQLEQIRKSLNSSMSGLDDADESDETKKDPDSWYNRMKSLEKEAGSLLNEVNSVRGKVTRADKFEMSEIDSIEDRHEDLKTRVDNLLLESADARAAVTSDVGKPRKERKKKKFLWLFGGGTDSDEYDELIGSVTPGRDRELFIVATREIRKRNFDVGRLLFQTIITTYPDSAYLPMAKLAVADSFYLEGSTSALIQASAGYQDWLTFFPTHPLADRVMLKIAEAGNAANWLARQRHH